MDFMTTGLQANLWGGETSGMQASSSQKSCTEDGTWAPQARAGNGSFKFVFGTSSSSPAEKSPQAFVFGAHSGDGQQGSAVEPDKGVAGISEGLLQKGKSNSRRPSSSKLQHKGGSGRNRSSITSKTSAVLEKVQLQSSISARSPRSSLAYIAAAYADEGEHAASPYKDTSDVKVMRSLDMSSPQRGKEGSSGALHVGEMHHQLRSSTGGAAAPNVVAENSEKASPGQPKLGTLPDEKTASRVQAAKESSQSETYFTAPFFFGDESSTATSNASSKSPSFMFQSSRSSFSFGAGSQQPAVSKQPDVKHAGISTSDAGSSPLGSGLDFSGTSARPSEGAHGIAEAEVASGVAGLFLGQGEGLSSKGKAASLGEKVWSVQFGQDKPCSPAKHPSLESQLAGRVEALKINGAPLSSKSPDNARPEEVQAQKGPSPSPDQASARISKGGRRLTSSRGNRARKASGASPGVAAAAISAAADRLNNLGLGPEQWTIPPTASFVFGATQNAAASNSSSTFEERADPGATASGHRETFSGTSPSDPSVDPKSQPDCKASIPAASPFPASASPQTTPAQAGSRPVEHHVLSEGSKPFVFRSQPAPSAVGGGNISPPVAKSPENASSTNPCFTSPPPALFGASGQAFAIAFDSGLMGAFRSEGSGTPAGSKKSAGRKSTTKRTPLRKSRSVHLNGLPDSVGADARSLSPEGAASPFGATPMDISPGPCEGSDTGTNAEEVPVDKRAHNHYATWREKATVEEVMRTGSLEQAVNSRRSASPEREGEEGVAVRVLRETTEKLRLGQEGSKPDEDNLNGTAKAPGLSASDTSSSDDEKDPDPQTPGAPSSNHESAEGIRRPRRIIRPFRMRATSDGEFRGGPAQTTSNYVSEQPKSPGRQAEDEHVLRSMSAGAQVLKDAAGGEPETFIGGDSGGHKRKGKGLAERQESALQEGSPRPARRSSEIGPDVAPCSPLPGSRIPSASSGSPPAKGSGSPVHQAAERMCEQWRLRGNHAYQSGDYLRAEDFYSRGAGALSQLGLSASPGCCRAAMLCWSNRAAVRMAMSRVREALADCSRAMAVDPSFLRVQLRAASCHLILGETTQAAAFFRDCSRRVSETSEGDKRGDAKVLAEASEGQRKAAQVEECIEKATTLLAGKQSSGVATSSSGGGVISTADALAALRFANEGLKTAHLAEVLLELKARALMAARRFEDVVQLCESTLQDAERNTVQVVKAVLENGTSLSPGKTTSTSPELWAVQGWRLKACVVARSHLGRLEEAIQGLDKLQAEQPLSGEPSPVFEWLGGETPAALKGSMKELLRHKKAGNKAFQEGHMDLAVEHYSAALGCNSASRPFNAVCLCNRAAASQALGCLADAVADCSRAIALDPHYAKAISRRATLHEILRDHSEAVKDLQRLRAMLNIRLQEQQQAALTGARGKPLASSATSSSKEVKEELRVVAERLRKAEEEARRDQPLDHYKLLGLEPSATGHEVKKAYRKAALRHHPDKAAQFLATYTGEDKSAMAEEVHREADRLFKHIGEAYGVLSDQSKRVRYESEEKDRRMASSSMRGNGGRGSSDRFQAFARRTRYSGHYGQGGPSDGWDKGMRSGTGPAQWDGYRWQTRPDAAHPDMYNRRESKWQADYEFEDEWA